MTDRQLLAEAAKLREDLRELRETLVEVRIRHQEAVTILSHLFADRISVSH